MPLPQVRQVHCGISFGCMSIAFGRLNKEDSKRAQTGALATLAFHRLQSLLVFKSFAVLPKDRDYGLYSNGVIPYTSPHPSDYVPININILDKSLNK